MITSMLAAQWSGFYIFKLDVLDRPTRKFERCETLNNRAIDPVNQLIRQDIDHLSVDELEERITLIQGEIDRCRAKIEKAVHHRATAESLFKR